MLFNKSIIIANGEEVENKVFNKYFNEKSLVICCDGAFNNLKLDTHPNIVIGDMDSIDISLVYNEIEENSSLENEILGENRSIYFEKFSKAIHKNIGKNITKFLKFSDQNTNDLTKAIKISKLFNIEDVIILGASGKREDHFIANFSLLFDYSKTMKVRMESRYGKFTSIKAITMFKSFKGQKVSLFSLNGTISSKNLKYELHDYRVEKLWMATLNESLGDKFTIDPHNSIVLVYQVSENKLTE